MDEQLVKTVDLENNHQLKIYDASRRIGADTYWVTLLARIEVSIEDALISGDSPGAAEIREVLGGSQTFEYRTEQNFVPDQEKDAVFRGILEQFLENTMPYLSKPGFPEKFILKQYRDRAACR